MSEEAIKLAEKLLKSDEDYLDNVIALWRIGNENTVNAGILNSTSLVK